MNFPRNIKIGLCLSAIFLAGGLLGALLTHRFTREEHARKIPFGNWSTKTMQLLQARLSLSQDQQPQVKAILEDTEKEFRARHCQEALERGQIIERTQKRVDQVLSPDQQKVHAQLIEEFRARDRNRLKFEKPPK